jgi:hypothetical protein
LATTIEKLAVVGISSATGRAAANCGQPEGGQKIVIKAQGQKARVQLEFLLSTR